MLADNCDTQNVLSKQPAEVRVSKGEIECEEGQQSITPLVPKAWQAVCRYKWCLPVTGLFLENKGIVFICNVWECSVQSRGAELVAWGIRVLVLCSNHTRSSEMQPASPLLPESPPSHSNSRRHPGFHPSHIMIPSFRECFSYVIFS